MAQSGEGVPGGGTRWDQRVVQEESSLMGWGPPGLRHEGGPAGWRASGGEQAGRPRGQ